MRSHFFGVVVGVSAALLCGGCTSPDESRAPFAGVREPEVRAGLVDLYRRDQRARKEMVRAVNAAAPPAPGEAYAPEAMPAVERVIGIDAEASAYLERVLDEYGWPTFEMVGRDGAEAAWAIAQHADRRPALQARALTLMEEAVAAGQAEPAKLAYLTDRVLVARGERQRYGTQFVEDDDGVHRPYPVEDGEPLDLRRARVGLPPMSFAARQWGEALGVRAIPEPLELWPGKRNR